MTPNPSSFQTITAMIVGSAQVDVPSQSWASPPSPTVCSALLTRPLSWKR
jgi:hypothetical protein